MATLPGGLRQVLYQRTIVPPTSPLFKIERPDLRKYLDSMAGEAIPSGAQCIRFPARCSSESPSSRSGNPKLQKNRVTWPTRKSRAAYDKFCTKKLQLYVAPCRDRALRLAQILCQRGWRYPIARTTTSTLPAHRGSELPLAEIDHSDLRKYLAAWLLEPYRAVHDEYLISNM